MLTLNPINQVIQQQRAFFATGKTKNIQFRKEQLHKLQQAIKEQKDAIFQALYADLHKPELESLFELNVVNEIGYIRKHLQSWCKPQKVNTPIEQFPASAFIYPEPLGIALIIGAWNYPFSVMISPLVGAIAAGNCAILKPSEISPHTSQVIAEIISQTFDPSYITVIEGGVETTQQLLAEKFDHILFTGGKNVGKIVMEAAAKHLTPVTLELGGKSPCIVDSEINLKETAKRIAWGKLINAGQTCIAPDYLLVDKTIKQDLIISIQECIRSFLGDNPANSPDYSRIVSEKHFNRLKKLLQQGGGTIITGGETNFQELYIAPTLIDNVSLDAPIMQEEIFGPILPILEYQDLEEAIALINSRPKPLALYIFSKNKAKQQQVWQNTSAGTVCINETMMQFGTYQLPFGGVGASGIGSYHGKASFDTFSHYKSVFKKPFLFEVNWRYAPYKNKIKILQKFLNLS